MNLCYKCTIELTEILEQKKSEFSFYRIHSNQEKPIENSNNVVLELVKPTEEETSVKQLEIIEPIPQPQKTEIEVMESPSQEIEQENKKDTKVVNLHKSPNANVNDTKTYNQRMKGGFFGRKRAR